MTREEIMVALDKTIDYKALSEILEIDLNNIATEINETGDPLSFKVFFDFNDFDTTIEGQAPGEGEGFYDTPILLSLLDGDFATERGPNIYSLVFNIEAFGFEKDRALIRKVFETYGALNQGKIQKEEISNAHSISFVSFPMITQPMPYKGQNRFSIFMSWTLTSIFEGQLTNDIKLEVEDEEIACTILNYQRKNNLETTQPNTEPILKNYSTSSFRAISGQFIYKNKPKEKEILQEILGNTVGKTFQIKLTFPLAEVEETYNMVLESGNISIIEGGILSIEFSFAESAEV